MHHLSLCRVLGYAMRNNYLVDDPPQTHEALRINEDDLDIDDGSGSGYGSGSGKSIERERVKQIPVKNQFGF